MGRSYQFGLLATAIAVGLPLFLILVFQPFPGRVVSVSWLGINIVAVKSPQTKNLVNAKKLANACELFATDHGGQFPVHLSELETDYLSAGTVKQLRYAVVWHGDEPQLQMDWLYFGPGFNETNPPRLLIASPQPMTDKARPGRIVIQGDTSGQVVKEDRYEQLLAETIRQMRAMQEPNPAATPTATPANQPAH